MQVTQETQTILCCFHFDYSLYLSVMSSLNEISLFRKPIHVTKLYEKHSNDLSYNELKARETQWQCNNECTS